MMLFFAATSGHPPLSPWVRGSLPLPCNMITRGTDFGFAASAVFGTYSYQRDIPKPGISWAIA